MSSHFPHISWEVIHGKHLGRTIGFPTANVAFFDDDLSPGTYGLSGIIDGKKYYGIGVYLPHETLFESHFFDFFDDIYGETIFVTPIFKIRDNQKFSGLDELENQIQLDRKVMKEWMNKEKK